MSYCTRWSLSLTRSFLILIVPSQNCTVKKLVQFPQKAHFSFQKQFLKSLILVSWSCPLVTLKKLSFFSVFLFYGVQKAFFEEKYKIL